MDVLGKNIFLIANIVFLCISFHVIGMDVVPASRVKELERQLADLKIQLTDKDAQLKKLEFEVGRKLIKNRMEIQGLEAKHRLSKESWDKKEEEYKKKLFNYQEFCKKTIDESEEAKKISRDTYEQRNANQREYNYFLEQHDAFVEEIKKYKEEYEELIQEYKEKKKNLSLEHVV
jgi:hypothetical protein